MIRLVHRRNAVIFGLGGYTQSVAVRERGGLGPIGGNPFSTTHGVVVKETRLRSESNEHSFQVARKSQKVRHDSSSKGYNTLYRDSQLSPKHHPGNG
jgi:hypothetical protein